MRELLKKAVFLASLGFVLGVLVGLSFLAIGGAQDTGDYGVGSLSVYILTSGLMGAVNTGATVIYAVERWGLLRTTLTHFCICMASICAVGFSVGWLSLDSAATWVTLAACIVVYIFIWAVMYMRHKREIRRMNEALERWKDAQRDE